LHNVTDKGIRCLSRSARLKPKFQRGHAKKIQKRLSVRSNAEHRPKEWFSTGSAAAVGVGCEHNEARKACAGYNTKLGRLEASQLMIRKGEKEKSLCVTTKVNKLWVAKVALQR
jgi:hypothetical protein